MKRIAPAFSVLLFCCLAQVAHSADLPQVASSSPAVCSLGDVVKGEKAPEPLFKAVLPPPCFAYTECPGADPVHCPRISYSHCWSSPGCWVNCNEDGFLFCPGREGAPECMLW